MIAQLQYYFEYYNCCTTLLWGGVIIEVLFLIEVFEDEIKWHCILGTVKLHVTTKKVQDLIYLGTK